MGLIKTMKTLFVFLFTFFFCFLKSQVSDDFFISDGLGNKNILINCSYPLQNENCVNLRANFPAYKLTNRYSVAATQFRPYTSGNKTVIKENLDDAFTRAIDLPFTFCFYGEDYKKLVIGSNGMVSFDVAQANQPNSPNFSSALPSTSLPSKAIFGVLHDLVFSASNDSEISYWVVGQAPYRKFVIDFTKGRVSGCEGQTSSSQIVLHEGSNNIEVFIDKKDLPCNLAQFKNALVGINDDTGTLGIAAPGRNTGEWNAQEEGWIFRPDGDTISPVFIWYDAAGNVIGRQGTQQVCPKKDDRYSVEMIYTLCSGENIVYRDHIEVRFSEEFPTVQPITHNVCNTSVPLKLSDFKNQLCGNSNLSDFNFEFRDKVTGQLADPDNPFILNGNRNYTVTVFNVAFPSCKAVTSLSIRVGLGNVSVTSLSLCEGRQTDYELSRFNPQIVGTGFSGTVTYFLNSENAQNNVNAITNTTLTNSTELFVRLVNQGCSEVLGPFTINFNVAPVVNPSVSFEREFCDINANGIEDIDWSAQIKNQVTADPTVTRFRVFNTLQEALNATSSQAGVTSVRVGTYKLYARVENAGGCFSIAEIDVKVVFKAISVRNTESYICFDGSKDIEVNLNTLVIESLVGPMDGTVSGPVFYSSRQGANTRDPLRIINPNQLITENGEFVSRTFFARYETNPTCYSVASINVNLINIRQRKDRFEVCDFANDNTETVQLVSSDVYTKQISNFPQARITFFSSLEAAQENIPGTALTSVVVNGSLTLYARTQVQNCSAVFPVTFSLVKSPEIKNNVLVSLSNICDNNADGKETVDVTAFEPQININSQAVTYTYFQTYNATNNTFSGQYPNPRTIELENGSVVYVRVANAAGCFSVAQLIFSLDFYPPVILSKEAVIKVCDPELNFGERFDLNTAVTQFFNPSSQNTLALSDLNITYYATEAHANSGNPARRIPVQYTTNAGSVTVFARAESRSTGCYSVAPITLQSYFPVRAKNTVIRICDQDLDGFYEVNLLVFRDQMVQTLSAENQFTFYLNEADIDVPGKEIQNPQHFILNPYVSSLWVKVVNLLGCGSSARISFVNENGVNLPSKSFNVTLCDEKNDGKETVDLTVYEAAQGAANGYEYYESQQEMIEGRNRIAAPKNYALEVRRTQRVFVKATRSGLCPDYFTVDYTLNATPIVTVEDAYYCKNNTVGIDIRPDFGALDIVHYKWEYPDGRIVEGSGKKFLTGVKTLGTYKLTITNTMNCSYTAVFNVVNVETPEITAVRGEKDYYRVESTGLPGRKVLYSMDLVKWQEENLFINLKEGDYTFYVRYADSDCYGDPRRGKIFTVSNGFTPNGDGINDYWQLTGLEVFRENSTLQIFDRQGAMVYQQVSNRAFQWDGTQQGRYLPTGSYWYVIVAADGRTYRGWIFLKSTTN